MQSAHLDISCTHAHNSKLNRSLKDEAGFILSRHKSVLQAYDSRHLARSNDLISAYFVLDEVLVLLIYVSRYLLDRIWQTGRTATAPANLARTEKTYSAPRQALVSYIPFYFA